MVTENIQLPVRNESKGVYREFVHAPDLESFLRPGEAGDKLPQEADRGQNAGSRSSPPGQSFDKIPPAMTFIIWVVQWRKGIQGKFIKFLSELLLMAVERILF